MSYTFYLDNDTGSSIPPTREANPFKASEKGIITVNNNGPDNVTICIQNAAGEEIAHFDAYPGKESVSRVNEGDIVIVKIEPPLEKLPGTATKSAKGELGFTPSP